MMCVMPTLKLGCHNKAILFLQYMPVLRIVVFRYRYSAGRARRSKGLSAAVWLQRQAVCRPAKNGRVLLWPAATLAHPCFYFGPVLLWPVLLWPGQSAKVLSSTLARSTLARSNFWAKSKNKKNKKKKQEKNKKNIKNKKKTKTN